MRVLVALTLALVACGPAKAPEPDETLADGRLRVTYAKHVNREKARAILLSELAKHGPLEDDFSFEVTKKGPTRLWHGLRFIRGLPQDLSHELCHYYHFDYHHEGPCR